MCIRDSDTTVCLWCAAVCSRTPPAACSPPGRGPALSALLGRCCHCCAAHLATGRADLLLRPLPPCLATVPAGRRRSPTAGAAA
eukprot:14580151-Alexandrium_andersonii.AAC.1